MRCTVANAVLLCILVNLSDCLSGDKVKLADVEFLTFRQGLYTTGRRSHSSVPQLNCRGGSAGCQDQPSVVQCYNRGTDGTDVQWECDAEMTTSQKFGVIQVKCEGYDYPQDEYILVGSCGLEYHLESTGHDGGLSLNASGPQRPSGYHRSTSTFPSLHDGVFSSVVNVTICVLAIIGACCVCCCCLALCSGGDANVTITSHQGPQEHSSSDAHNRSPATPTSSIHSLDIRSANYDGVIVEERKEKNVEYIRYHRAVPQKRSK